MDFPFLGEESDRFTEYAKLLLENGITPYVDIEGHQRYYGGRKFRARVEGYTIDHYVRNILVCVEETNEEVRVGGSNAQQEDVASDSVSFINIPSELGGRQLTSEEVKKTIDELERQLPPGVNLLSLERQVRQGDLATEVVEELVEASRNFLGKRSARNLFTQLATLDILAATQREEVISIFVNILANHPSSELRVRAALRLRSTIRLLAKYEASRVRELLDTLLHVLPADPNIDVRIYLAESLGYCPFPNHPGLFQALLDGIKHPESDLQWAVKVARERLSEKVIFNQWFEKNRSILDRVGNSFPGHLEHIDRGCVESWLQQFGTPYNMELALTLLQKVEYISDDVIRARFAAFMQHQLTGEGEYSKYLSQPSFAVLGSTRDSSGKWTHLCHKTLEGVMQDKWPSLDVHMLGEMPPHERPSLLLFVDDVIGTGFQCCEVFREWTGEIATHKFGGKLDSESLKILRETPILIWTAVGFVESINDVKKVLQNLRVDVLDIVTAGPKSKSQGCFSRTVCYFTSESDRQSAQEIMKKIGYELLQGKDHLTEEQRRVYALGYGGYQQLLVLAYNTPTITLPVLWASGKYERILWKPLFPRR